uniref:Uncharacterized protein n=1 Tax=viral metagenome TaxID=1070528 RepID=A0A6C0LKG8_9ZZZZ
MLDSHIVLLTRYNYKGLTLFQILSNIRKTFNSSIDYHSILNICTRMIDKGILQKTKNKNGVIVYKLYNIYRDGQQDNS